MQESDSIIVQSHNAVHYRIISSPGILREIQDIFTFYAPNYKHTPLYKMGRWDGKIKLFSLKERLLYCGLLNELIEFCNNRNYKIDLSDLPNKKLEVSLNEVNQFTSTLNIFELRDYQINSVRDAINYNNLVLKIPTNGGKTAVAYSICRYYDQLKKLYVVPDTGLLNQTEQKFIEYGYEPEQIHTIFSGQEKQTDHLITISTWQSLMNMPKEYFSQWQLIIGDECHKFKAEKLKYIMENSINCYHRIGMTGSLDGSLVNELTLKGLFGPIIQPTTTKQLIDNQWATPIKIYCLMLKYKKQDRDFFKPSFKRKYVDEVEFLLGHQTRNQFIVNLALELKGNTLILGRYVDKMCIPLYEEIKKKTNKKTFLVYGNIIGKERTEIAKKISQEKTSITVASSQTFSTGIDIPNIDNLILISATKAPIPLIQSIGRILRKDKNKTVAKVFDLVDDCSYISKNNKKKNSYSVKHSIERMKTYASEQHHYIIKEVEL